MQKKIVSKMEAIDIILEILIAYALFLLSLSRTFVHNSNSTEIIIASYVGKTGLFLMRFKFATYLEKILRKKVLQKYQGNKLR